jgi:PAS domain S-box-containing protein
MVNEEYRYRSLIEHLSAGVYRSTPDGRLLEANQAMADLLGFDSREALLAQEVQDLYVNEEARRRHVQQLETDPQRPAEFALRRTDGSVVWVRDYPRAIEDADGTVTHYDGVLVDITERKRVERQRDKSASRLRTILENVTDLIAVCDADGVLHYASGAVAEITGFTSSEVEGHSVFEHMHPDDVTEAKRKFQTLLDRPDVLVEHDFRFRHRDDSWHFLSVRMRNLRARVGTDVLLGTVRDVTQRKRFEQQLVEAREEAEELARLKTTFLANMSHEIRTPLASILGFAEVLVEESEGELREFAELIQQGGERLSETLDSVLDLARLEVGGFEPEFEAVSVGEVMQEAAALYAPMAEEKNLTFYLDEPDEALHLWGDRAGVGRMLANLLSNAIKFTEEGTITLAARRAGEQDAGEQDAEQNAGAANEHTVELRVSDTGVGMDEDFRERLFEAFRQESSGLRHLHEGAGLGMAITSRLADVMDADIRVESQKGEGTTFRLHFSESAPSTEEHSKQERPPLLVIEDNENTRRLLRHLLRKDWTPTLTADPQSALAAAADTDFAVVLVDISLGTEMNGVDVMKRLRRRGGHYAEAPFVALTAYAMPGDAKTFADHGFDAYLAKPFANEELMETLRRVAG